MTDIYLDDLDAFVAEGKAIRADTLDLDKHPDQWVLVDHMHGARRRQVLLTSPGNTAPVLKFGVDLRGPHTIYVGYHGNSADRHVNGLYVRLAGEPHFTRMIPERTEPVYVEGWYKTVDLTGPTSIEVASFGLRSGLDYIRLVPGKVKAPPKPKGKSFGICDFITSAMMNKPAGFEAGSCVRQHHDAGFNAIIWKAFKVLCEWHTNIGVRRDMGVEYDTLRQAVDEAKMLGMEIYGWMRFNNEESKIGSTFNPVTPFHLAHPHARQLRKDGHPRPRTGFAFPEVRRFKADLVREVAAYGVDGICIDVLRQPPAVEYDLPMVQAYIEKYGEDPRQMPGDGSERWLRFKSEAFTQFLRDCRAVLNDFPRQNRKRMPLIVRTMDQVWRNLQCGCDVEKWLEEDLVDGLIFAAHLPAPDLYPQKLNLTHWLQLAQRTAPHVPVYGQVWNCGSVIEAEVLAGDLYAQGVAGIAIYESEFAVARPWVREHLWRFNSPDRLRYGLKPAENI